MTELGLGGLTMVIVRPVSLQCSVVVVVLWYKELLPTLYVLMRQPTTGVLCLIHSNNLLVAFLTRALNNVVLRLINSQSGDIHSGVGARLDFFGAKEIK